MAKRKLKSYSALVKERAMVPYAVTITIEGMSDLQFHCWNPKMLEHRGPCIPLAIEARRRERLGSA